MCGIAGIVSKHPVTDYRILEGLVDGIAHRGPDDCGNYLSPGKTCALGHSRLAILDLSAAGHQPMLDETSGNVIVFNGEIYNFAALRKACEADGYRFHSHSDTEVILALYLKHGIDCLKLLRGMFAFAIWDEKNKRLFFARDRLGKKPFNYAVSSHGFAFCSEIDPLARHSWTNRQLDNQALDFFLHLQYIPAPFSIYKGIRKLPPAHFGLLDASGLRIESYWHIDYRNKCKINEADALDAFEEKLSEAVRLRMVADVPVGALLSGGVDSSVIVALMAKFAASPVRTFSIGFSHSDFDESAFARQAAGICGTLHRPSEMAAPDLNLLPALVKHYGEPYGDPSALPSFAVCAAARQELKVVMNGDGGDELLGGYPRYSLSDANLRFATWTYRGSPLPLRYPARWMGTAGNFPWKKMRRLTLQNLLPDAGPFIIYGSSWDDRTRHSLLYGSVPQDNLPKWRESWLRGARSNADNPVDSMLWIDNHTYLPGDLLAKMDIASMHYGLEARSPLLDHELIEFCASLPISCKVTNGTGKYLLKKLAERFFPREFVYRRKMGFGIPMVEWMRGPFRPLMEDILHDSSCMSPLDLSMVVKSWEKFLTQDNDEAIRVWPLFMFGLWRRHCAPA